LSKVVLQEDEDGNIHLRNLSAHQTTSEEVYTHIHTCTHTDTIPTYIHIHTYIHTYTHTYTYTNRRR